METVKTTANFYVLYSRPHRTMFLYLRKDPTGMPSDIVLEKWSLLMQLHAEYPDAYVHPGGTATCACCRVTSPNNCSGCPIAETGAMFCSNPEYRAYKENPNVDTAEAEYNFLVAVIAEAEV